MVTESKLTPTETLICELFGKLIAVFLIVWCCQFMWNANMTELGLPYVNYCQALTVAVVVRFLNSKEG